MMNSRTLALSVFFSACAMQAQTQPFVRVSGQGTISVKPDQFKLSISVNTQGATAQEASDMNATQTDAVIAKVTAVLGSTGELRTIGYSVNPVYRANSNPPAIIAYSATNSLEVTCNNLALAGRVIDTATQAAVTTVSSLRFLLRDAEPTRLAAMKVATQQARIRADALASGLNLRVGVILSIEETSVALPSPIFRTGVALAPSATPIEPGTLDVSVSVTLEAAILN